MAKAKSESPSRNAKISRARQSVRTSSARWRPPCSAATTALRKPPSPSAFTRARQAASRSACGNAASVASAQRASAWAKRRWPSSKNGQLSVSSRLILIALEYRLLLGSEGAERAPKILRLHAQRLGDRLGLDGALDRHRPFHVEHALGHSIGERRPGGKFGGKLLRLRQHGVGRGEPVEETPTFRLLAAKHAAGIEQFGRAARANEARQDGARPHVAAGQAHAVEEKRHLGARRSQAHVASHGQDRAGAGAYAVDGGDDRLRARAHGLDHLAGHAGEIEKLRRLHLDERLDDLEDVAAGAEIAAGTGDDERPDGFLSGGRAEEIDDLGVAVEGERVFLVGPVERDGGDLAVDRKANVARLVLRKRQGDGVGCAHRGAPLPIALRADALVLARSRIRVSMSSAESSASMSPIQSPFARAIARKKRRPSAVRLTSCARRSLGEGRRLTSPCSSSRSTRPVTLPFDTIMRCDSSPSVIAFGAR